MILEAAVLKHARLKAYTILESLEWESSPDEHRMQVLRSVVSCGETLCGLFPAVDRSEVLMLVSAVIQTPNYSL